MNLNLRMEDLQVRSIIDDKDHNAMDSTTGSIIDDNCWNQTCQQQVEEDLLFGGPISDVVARPLDFPTPLVYEGQLNHNERCVDHNTGKEYTVKNILTRADDQDNNTHRAYLITKKLKQLTHGNLRLAIVLKRRDPSTSALLDGQLQWETTDELVSIKVLSFEKINNLRGRHLADPIKEISALQHVGNSHPNVAGCLEVLQDEKYLYTVTRYCPNGDLYSRIEDSKPHISREEDSRIWFRQLLLGLLHLQHKGVTHRNINFDNLMIDRNDKLVLSNLELCLRVPYSDPCNVGHVTDISEGNERLMMTPQGQCGDLMFLAPEILENKPFDGFASDLYSAGIILFVLLVGMAPFQVAQNSDKRYEMISKGELEGLLKSLDISLSPEAVDLLQHILFGDPSRRLSLADVMNHPWVVNQRFPTPWKSDVVATFPPTMNKILSLAPEKFLLLPCFNKVEKREDNNTGIQRR